MEWRNYIAGFLAIYMVTLILLPCNDACNSHEHETPLTIQTAQDHHEEDKDFCSPFCYCTCCVTAMTAVHNPGFNFIPHSSDLPFSLLNQVFLSKEFSSIWQPPRLS